MLWYIFCIALGYMGYIVECMVWKVSQFGCRCDTTTTIALVVYLLMHFTDSQI